MITVQEATEIKGCSRPTILNAITKGQIDAERFGHKMWMIIQNPKFEAWHPSERHQDSGRARWSTSKKKGRK